MESNGRVAIVTGAGSGIGRSAALHLLRDGYSVGLAGRREDPLKETIELSGVDPSRAIAVTTDVGEESSIKSLSLISSSNIKAYIFLNRLNPTYSLFTLIYD